MFFERLWLLGRDTRSLGQARLAAIGPSTADALQEFRLRADLMPMVYRAEELAAALCPVVRGKRVLWVRADRGRDVLPTELSAAGAELQQLVVYRHRDVAEWSHEVVRLLSDGQLDWIGVSSPAIARNVARLLPDAARQYLGQQIRLASISPVTTAACQEVGLPVSAEAAEYTWNGILDAIVQAEQERAAKQASQ